MLHSHLSGFEPARPLKRVHASALTKPDGLCPRYYALHDVAQAKPKDQWLTTSEQITFRLGHELQDAVVNWFADMGKAIGHWRCRACQKVVEFATRPAKCLNCGCRGFQAEEVRFESAISGASCGIDLLLSLGEQKLRVVELKTMAADQFKGLAGPLAEHRLRTNFYLRLIAESEHPWARLVNTQTAKILYVSKGYGVGDLELGGWGLSEKFSPFKEMTITRADSATDAISWRAKVVKDFRRGVVGMPVGICPTAMCKRAAACSIRKQCFGGEHSPVYDWQAAYKERGRDDG